jgi:allophanate hydrolase
MSDDLQLTALAALYEKDPAAPERILRDVHRRVRESAPEIWIHRASLDVVLAQLRRAEERKAKGHAVPLFGVPFAVKDNIDVGGMPTTAACPAFEYVPSASAEVVERLVSAGAIVLGKTNLDQFATGLVGVRSPYGICKNTFDARYVSGGSSAGSGVAVALGLVSFALGTDTAGSGRVPAAFNNIVGLKPTRGIISTRGVVPACRSLDCVSVFAGNARDAFTVLSACAGFDPADPFSRDPERERPPRFPEKLRFGVPRADQLEFFGDAEAARLYAESVARLERLGAVRVEVDFEPFSAAAALLYAGPWVAERLVAAGALLDENPEVIHPAVRKILEGARAFSALDAFEADYSLRALRRRADAEWTKMDLLVLPTTPTIYSIAEVEAEPIERNTRLGYYTNFVNLLDLAAIAVPAGFRADGLPLGVTLLGPAHSDRELSILGARLHAESSAPPVKVGATSVAVDHRGLQNAATSSGDFLVAVAGAHLGGEPLNHQLTSRNAKLVRTCKTSRHYRFYALHTTPPKPGLVFDPMFDGDGIEVEVWSLDAAAFASFVGEVPQPLAIGTVILEDGSSVNGFVCESYALTGALDITQSGGWRMYRNAAST